MKKTAVFEPVVEPVESHPGIESGPAIVRAFLHQALTWPGVCGAEKTISADKIRGGLKMHLTTHGLFLEVGNKKNLIPYANIANCILSD